ncbi:MAG: hypothetical protein KDI68_08190 [Gammaproteobacteria bacterium]|nr:hypothetical protein [Gammaproteobacteria bacterium]
MILNAIENEALREELIARAERDQELLQSLKDAGELMDDEYHPQLKQLHQDNTLRARELLREGGWPGISQVGEDGSDAMWLIVQHSVLEPEFMLSCVPELERLVRKNEAKGWQLAFLQDRALMLQEQPQIYGTQHLLDADGELQPYRLADPAGVDELRKAVGLEPLAERTRLLRADRERVLRARKARAEEA